MNVDFLKDFTEAINEWGGAQTVEAIYLVGCSEYFEDVTMTMRALRPKGKLQPIGGGPLVFNHPNMQEEFERRFKEGGTYHSYSWRESLPLFLQDCTRGLFVKLYNGAVLRYSLPKVSKGENVP